MLNGIWLTTNGKITAIFVHGKSGAIIQLSVFFFGHFSCFLRSQFVTLKRDGFREPQKDKALLSILAPRRAFIIFRAIWPPMSVV